MHSNSRAKDLYDLVALQKAFPEAELEKVAEAMEKTNRQRNLELTRRGYMPIINYLANSDKQRNFWKKFQFQNSYARPIAFEEVFGAVRTLTQKLVDVY